MSLKIKDFASHSEENVSGRTKQERRGSPEEESGYYDPPRRSHQDRHSSESSRRSDSRRRSYSRSPSRNPRFQEVPQYRDQKPFFGPRDNDRNIQVNWIKSQDTKVAKCHRAIWQIYPCQKLAFQGFFRETMHFCKFKYFVAYFSK